MWKILLNLTSCQDCRGCDAARSSSEGGKSFVERYAKSKVLSAARSSGAGIQRLEEDENGLSNISSLLYLHLFITFMFSLIFIWLHLQKKERKKKVL